MSLQAERPGLILASGSATRRAMLEAAGLRFITQAVAIDEPAVREAAQAEGVSAEEAALLLASAKAARVRVADAIVVGADQILVQGEDWFGKATDLDGARTQLRRLRGSTHRLATAVVCFRNGEAVWQHVESPALTMRAFSDMFLDAYVAQEGAQLLDSVGCYRLEGPGIHLFERIAGSHEAILGLPLLPLLAFLRQHGVLVA
jgi:septum formation protein